MIKPLETNDCPWVRAMAMKLAAIMYPELISDIEKVHWLVRDCLNSTAHYARVVRVDAEPRAVLLARTGNNQWAMKKHCTIFMWYSEIPGAGVALLRDFRRWVDSEKQQIVLAGFCADWVTLDDRPLKLAARVGFKQRGEGSYMYFPRGRKAA